MTDSDRMAAALSALGPGTADDAALNLAAVLYELRTGQEPDPVMLDTLDRVVAQIIEAQDALKAAG